MNLLLLALVQGVTALTAPPLTTTEIVDHMVHAENERLAAFSGYTGMRRYTFENRRVNKHAEMTVRVVCDRTGAKTFEVIVESGSGFVRNHVIRRMIDAEHEASEKGEHEQTRIIPQNYDFRLLGTNVVDGRPCYLLEIIPKAKNKFMVIGRIWVDAEDFAITRLEGSPAKNPSFWIRNAHVVHQYDRIGKFWLPVADQSQADARIFGATSVGIEYFNYVISGAQHQSSQISATGVAFGAIH